MGGLLPPSPGKGGQGYRDNPRGRQGDLAGGFPGTRRASPSPTVCQPGWDPPNQPHPITSRPRSRLQRPPLQPPRPAQPSRGGGGGGAPEGETAPPGLPGQHGRPQPGPPGGLPISPGLTTPARDPPSSTDTPRSVPTRAPRPARILPAPRPGWVGGSRSVPAGVPLRPTVPPSPSARLPGRSPRRPRCYRQPRLRDVSAVAIERRLRRGRLPPAPCPDRGGEGENRGGAWGAAPPPGARAAPTGPGGSREPLVPPPRSSGTAPTEPLVVSHEDGDGGAGPALSGVPGWVPRGWG